MTRARMVSFRMNAFEHCLAEAVVAKRAQGKNEAYSLSDLMRESLMRTVREDLREELAAT